MTSIDELFKPSTSGKRKLDVSHNPAQYYKSAKYAANGDVKGKKHPMVEDEVPEIDDDVEAGPSLPADEGEQDGPEDEEGRFFGGGIDRRGLAALEYLDERDAEGTFEGEERYDAAWLRRTNMSFEKKILKNTDLRARYAGQPKKFMASEAELDDEIKKLSILSEHPEHYEDFSKLGGTKKLVGLLVHENTDIAIAALEVINELLDDEVQATDDQLGAFIKAALDANLLQSISAQLKNLDESEPADRDGVYQCLSILVSLSSQPAALDALAVNSELLKWLLDRIQAAENPVSQNKQTAAEAISVLLQSSMSSRRRLVDLDAVDIMLQQLAPYRRVDPEPDSPEEEFAENLFDALAYLVQEPSGKAKFLEAEGVELAILMAREGKLSQVRALQLLDFAVGGSTGKDLCEKLVDFEGLKTIFKIFAREKDPKTLEHVLDIFAALLRNLSDGSEERIRLMLRFQADNYKAVARIVELRSRYVPRVKTVDEAIQKQRASMSAEEQAEMELDWLDQRLDAGLSVLQTIDIVLAWLVIEYDKAKKKISKLLKANKARLEDVRKTLKAQRRGIEDESEEAQASKEMLGALITLLKE